MADAKDSGVADQAAALVYNFEASPYFFGDNIR